MNKSTSIILAVLVAGAVGVFLGRLSIDDHQASVESSVAERQEILYWVAPMDPNFRRDEPGKSPMGMDLVPVYAGEVDSESGVVTIDPVVVNNLGVRTATAERSSLPRRIDTVGYVNYDEETVQHVHTRVEGWIENLAITSSGDSVEAGQLLFELYSPALVNAQQEYLSALRSNNAALKTASEERLVALGMAPAAVRTLARERVVQQRVSVTADRSGIVNHLGVREGMFVKPETEVLSIANLDTVWVYAEVFERQAAWVAPGQAARVTLDYRPGTEIVGEVDYVYPELDRQSRTLRVRLRFENPGAGLLPNMFARVRIDGRPTGPVVHVPREAVVRGGDENRVVIDIGSGRFKSRAVRVGIESGDRIAIRAGLEAGEQVVTSAQFLIDSESNRAMAFDRMSASDDHGSHQHMHDQELDAPK
ncbi:MAG: efflux RND transporter periplasmic adaptor subunit [Woeseiaceae bacterium]|nr:efflux RND transporter periplasmic adaptor subunit [Woeseiaceae bacterium]